jgi:hypothetical protein
VTAPWPAGKSSVSEVGAWISISNSEPERRTTTAKATGPVVRVPRRTGEPEGGAPGAVRGAWPGGLVGARRRARHGPCLPRLVRVRIGLAAVVGEHSGCLSGVMVDSYPEHDATTGAGRMVTGATPVSTATCAAFSARSRIGPTSEPESAGLRPAPKGPPTSAARQGANRAMRRVGGALIKVSWVRQGWCR